MIRAIRLVILVYLCVLFVPQALGASGIPVWVAREEGVIADSQEEVRASARLVDGSIMVLATSAGSSPSSEHFVFRYAPDGTQLSLVTLEAPSYSSSWLVTPFGEVILSGSVGSRLSVMKYDGYTGRRHWPQAALIGDGVETIYSGTLRMGPTGDIFLGTARRTTTDEVVVVRLNGGDGALEWRANVNLGPGEFLSTMEITSAGDVVAGGSDFNSSTVVTRLHVFTLNGTTGGTAWDSTQTGVSMGVNDRIAKIVLDSAGGIIAAGKVRNASGNDDALIMKYTSSGTLSWKHILGAAAGTTDLATTAAIDPFNNAYWAGYTQTGSAQSDVYTGKISSAGTVQWTVTKAASNHERAIDMVVDGNSDAVITGWANAQTTGASSDIGTWKLRSANGATAWLNTFNAGSNDLPVRVLLDDSGDLFVAGTSSTAVQLNRVEGVNGTSAWGRNWADSKPYVGISGSGADAAGNITTMRYDAFGVRRVSRFDGATGARLWTLRQSISPAQGLSLATAPDGSFALYGSESGNGMVQMYNSDGTLRWTKTWGGASTAEHAVAAAFDASGNVIVTGTAEQTQYGPTNVQTLKLSAAAGTQLWLHTHTGGSNSARPYAIAVDAAGNVAVAGRQRIPPSTVLHYTHLALKIDGATGTLLWPAQFNGLMFGDESKQFVTCAVDGSGNVFLSGTETPGTNYDIVTRKLDAATGSVLWTTSYAGTADDLPVKLAADSAGNPVLAARADLGSGDAKIVVEKYAGTTGLLDWSRSYDAGAGQPDEPTALRIGASDEVWVAGLMLSLQTMRDSIVLRWAADGTPLWGPAPFDDHGGDQRRADLHFAGSDVIVVTGDSLARLGEPLGIFTSAIPAATVGSTYSFTIAAANGTAPYTFSSSNLPGFLALHPSTGELSATLVPPGSWQITIDVTDAASVTASRTFYFDSFYRDENVSVLAGANPACISTTLSTAGSWSTYLWSTSETTPTITAPVAHEAVYGVSLQDGTRRGAITLRGLQPLGGVTIAGSGAMSACPSGTGGTIYPTVTGGGSVTYQWGYRSTPGGTITNIAGQTGSSYTINGAHFPGLGTWYVVVRVTPACGSVATSNEVAVQIVDLAAPTNVIATATSPGTITVSWTGVFGVDHYNVYRSDKLCPGQTFSLVGSSYTTSYTDFNRTPGADYSYLVRSASAGNSCLSPASACDDATAYGDCTPDPTFSGLTTATANNCLIRLSWSAASSNCLNAKSIAYNVYRSTSSTFTPAPANRIARCVTSPFYDDISAPNGTNYYVVRAEDSTMGNGGACNGGNEEQNVVRRSAVMSTPTSTTTHYRDNFDTIRPASNPNAYWKEIITSGPDQIAFSTCKVDAATSYKFGTVGICTGTYASSSNQRLELGGDGTVDPLINGLVVPASGSVRLRFRHLFQFESSWDGASLYYRTNSVTTPTLVGESVSATAPYLQQGLYTGNASSSGHRAWTGTQSSFTDVIVNLDAIRGRTVWFQWRFTSDSIINYDGYHLDDVNLETVTPLACDITGPVQAFTVTARDGVNKLEWLNPASTHYGTTILRYRTDGVYPVSATDGQPVGSGTKTGFSDLYDTVDHTVTNGTAYRYTAFVQAANGLVGPARGAMGRAEPVASTKWIYNTGATAMTPPGIGSIYAVSNDRILHSIQEGTAGGTWAAGWRPFAMNGPSQARPVIASMTLNQIGGAAKVAFISSQDGYVYAVNGDTGAQLWGTSIATMVAGSPALAFRELGATLTNVDLVLAGTRNSTPPNGLYGLNTQGGAAAWSYTGGGTYTIGIIGGQPAVDAVARRVYFASRAASASTNQNHTLWCLSFDDTTVTRVWSVVLGDIDGSPLLANGTLYVGTNTGVLYAIDPATGATLASYATNDGPVKGAPQADANGRIYFSTTNKVWALVDSLSGPRTLTAAWSVASIGVPSSAVLAQNAIWAGSSNGRLYKLSQLTDPTPVIAYTTLGTGLAAVGPIGYDSTNDLAYVGAADGAIYAVSIP